MCEACPTFSTPIEFHGVEKAHERLPLGSQMTPDAVHSGDRTLLDTEATGGLGPLEILHPPGTFALTPASRISIEAIARHHGLLHGIGLDWGSGTGCLSILACRIPQVKFVVGLEVSPLNVAIAWENAARNGVSDKSAFLLSDSYSPRAAADRETLHAFEGGVNFLLANPPSSEGDDGFGFRRAVLRGARKYLADGGLVFLSVSYQYGAARIARLCHDAPGFEHFGILSTTDWVPFDLRRPDLLHCLELYSAEESRGGLEYSFPDPASPEKFFGARRALANFRGTGESPLSRWQTHLFRYEKRNEREA
jgi:Methyltransferase small domain